MHQKNLSFITTLVYYFKDHTELQISLYSDFHIFSFFLICFFNTKAYLKKSTFYEFELPIWWMLLFFLFSLNYFYYHERMSKVSQQRMSSFRLPQLFSESIILKKQLEGRNEPAARLTLISNITSFGEFILFLCLQFSLKLFVSIFFSL